MISSGNRNQRINPHEVLLCIHKHLKVGNPDLSIAQNSNAFPFYYSLCLTAILPEQRRCEQEFSCLAPSVTDAVHTNVPGAPWLEKSSLEAMKMSFLSCSWLEKPNHVYPSYQPLHALGGRYVCLRNGTIVWFWRWCSLVGME